MSKNNINYTVKNPITPIQFSTIYLYTVNRQIKQYQVKIFDNKRAQRVLGRSPEEKVKGHSGANNREPQGHNLSNFGKGPFDDVIF